MRRAEQILSDLPGVVTVDDVRMRWIGHRLSVDATVDTNPAMPVGNFHAIEHDADRDVRAGLPSIGSVRLTPSAHNTPATTRHAQSN